MGCSVSGTGGRCGGGGGGLSPLLTLGGEFERRELDLTTLEARIWLLG